MSVLGAHAPAQVARHIADGAVYAAGHRHPRHPLWLKPLKLQPCQCLCCVIRMSPCRHCQSIPHDPRVHG